ncbi:hypothetical protein AKN88_10150 [Thiopseudomonas alkaliphila]|uniref:HEPN domain-containing protein n=1 Tax=Thiopseudomonas alkaliphila TaxID=1697053 RepID=A0A0K1XGF6_9GAMM|nr:hypothetical protein [Thiopseudomonas alkaliphila]AKX60248.1 hypothetical protein AKN88_10150 [Thiopseudomonas alkaliphila]
MSSKCESIKKEVRSLVVRGKHLYLAMLNDISGLPDEVTTQLEEKKIKLPNFTDDYDSWYSEAIALIKQLLPDRLEDFKRQYKDEKRKEISFLTYGISDYLYGLRTTRGYQQDVIADKSAAVGKMQVQNSILAAVEKRLDSSLFDIQEILQADLFDSELSAAKELAKKGFFRGAGAIAGVVLEKHLGHICDMHNFKSRKKHPSISDFYQLLKENDVIDIPKWRFIQHLGDLRNLCDHNKDREPTKEDVLELIEGVQKVIKTVF